MPISKKCKVCEKIFSVPPSRDRIKTCSIKCGGIFRRTKKKVSCKVCKRLFFASKYRVENNLVSYCSKKCFGIGNRGESNYLWKGKEASYRTIHHWVNRHYGRANKCEDCGLDCIPEGKKRYFDWANISGEYKRDISDWKQLCKLCHRAFDKK